MSEHTTFEDVLGLQTPEPDAVVPYGDDENQYGELWLSKEESKGLVIYIHGGCWLKAFNIGHSRPLCDAARQSGFTVFSLEYRRIGDPGGGYPGTFEDISRAIGSLESLNRWNVDVARPVLAGHSAGGHLALWAGAKHSNVTAGSIGLAPIADLERYARGDSMCEKATVQLMGGTPEELPELYRSVSPATMNLHPNTFVVHGTNDTIVPIAQGESVDLPPDHLREVDAGHFELIHPETSAFGIVLETFASALS